MQPSPRAETSRLLFPSLRFFIVPPRQGNSLPQFPAEREIRRSDWRNIAISTTIPFLAKSPVLDSYVGQRQKAQTREPSVRMMKSPVSGLNALQPPSSAATINRTSAPFLLSQNAIFADKFLRIYLFDQSSKF